jgi:mannose-1-phosphate guanylyltransferase
MFERGLFPLLLERGEPVYGYPHHGYWLDMGTLEKYLGLNCDLLRAKTTSHLMPPPNRDESCLEPDTTVHPTASVTGPVAIGRRCRIDEGARIVGPVAIGNDCHIGAGAYLENSVLWDGASVSAGASYKQCVICLKDGKEQIVSCDGQQ